MAPCWNRIECDSKERGFIRPGGAEQVRPGGRAPAASCALALGCPGAPTCPTQPTLSPFRLHALLIWLVLLLLLLGGISLLAWRMVQRRVKGE